MIKSLLLLAGLTVTPILATAAAPTAPQTLVIITCRVDDLTGQPGREQPYDAAPTWRDLEWHLDKGLELECRRDVVPLEDQVASANPDVRPLLSDFSKPLQCARAGAMFGPGFAKPGWAVMAVGCPVRIETDGKLTGWKLPDCPSSIGGKPIKCRFDGSLI